MVFFKRRGGIKKKQLVTKSFDLLIADYEAFNLYSGSSSAAAYPVGKSHNNTGKPSAVIYSSGSSKTGEVVYGFDFPSIPDDAQNAKASFMARGYAEDSSKSNSKFQMALYWHKSNGARRMSPIIAFSQNTSAVMGASCVIADNIKSGESELDALRALKLYVDVGYYGGILQGVTLTITYDVYE